MGYLIICVVLGCCGWVAGAYLNLMAVVLITVCATLILTGMFRKMKELESLIPTILLAFVAPFFVGLWVKVLMLEGVIGGAGSWIAKTFLR